PCRKVPSRPSCYSVSHATDPNGGSRNLQGSPTTGGNRPTPQRKAADEGEAFDKRQSNLYHILGWQASRSAMPHSQRRVRTIPERGVEPPRSSRERLSGPRDWG